MSTINKIKDALHINKDHTATHTTGTHTTGTHTTGTTHNTTGSVPEGTAGPHDSRLANAADPRVDSDLDSSRNTGHTGTGTGVTGTHHNNGLTGAGTGVTGTHHNNGLTGAGNGVTGTHHNTGLTGTGTGVTGTHHNGGYTGTSATGAGVTGTAAGASTNAGPHNSNLMNKLDPTVDSDLDGSRHGGATSGQRTAGYSGTGTGNTAGGYSSTGTTGGISNSTNAGPHNSNLANKVDPRVDSDLSSTGNRHGAATGGIIGASGSHATPGSGTAQNTAGPHNSDLLNKLDPRVDADLDGSKTYGGDRTRA